VTVRLPGGSDVLRRAGFDAQPLAGDIASVRATAAELRALVAEQLLLRSGDVASGERFDALVDDVASRTTDPYSAVDALLADRA
jgi:hypothetical protein